MTQNFDPSRRHSLKFLAGLPLLPLAGGAAGLLSACGGGSSGGDSSPATGPVAETPSVTAVAFTGMAAPSLAVAAEMATTLVKSSMEVTYSNGSKQSFALKY